MSGDDAIDIGRKDEEEAYNWADKKEWAIVLSIRQIIKG